MDNLPKFLSNQIKQPSFILRSTAWEEEKVIKRKKSTEKVATWVNRHPGGKKGEVKERNKMKEKV